VAYQDLTTYTKADPNSRLTVTSARCTHTELTKDEDCWLYWDFGADHFDGDFEHREAIYFDDAAVTGRTRLWALTNEVEDALYLIQNDKTFLNVSIRERISTGGAKEIVLQEVNAGDSYGDTYVCALDTIYHIKVKRVWATSDFKCYIYEDDAGEPGDLLGTLTLTLHAQTPYQFFFATLSQDSDQGASWTSGYVENIDLQEAGGAEYEKVATIYIGAASTASRAVELSRTGSISLGLAVSASVNKFREIIATVYIGASVTAGRLQELVRTGTVQAGLSVTASRLTEILRTGATALGLMVLAEKFREVIALVKIGLGVLGEATLNLQIGASSDDCRRDKGSSPYFGLNAQYQLAGGDNSFYQVGGGMRFTDVAIPRGAIITNAYLTFKASFSKSGTTVRTRISAEDVDDAPTFADDAGAFDTRWANRTTARIDWDSIPAWTYLENYDSPDIKEVIQEVIDRAGWNSGNAMVFFWEDYDNRSSHNDDAHRAGYSYDEKPTDTTKLHIEYEISMSSRLVEIFRTGTTQIGLSATASRAVEVIRSASVAIGEVVTAVAHGTATFIAEVQIGLNVSGSRTVEVARSGAVYIGLAVSAVYSQFVEFIGSVAIGMSVSASRLAEIIRTPTVQIGLSVTASRAVEIFRSGLVTIGEVVTASFIAGREIVAFVSIGMSVTASKVKELFRVGTTAIGLAVTASFLIPHIGRLLKVKVVTMAYRNIKVVTLSYRVIKAVTGAYRKIKIGIFGG